LKPAVLDQLDTVIHLHGSILDPTGMIVTTPDYISHYRNDRMSNDGDTENNVLTFLEVLFKTKTVLFIGYGLEELEILEYVIQKARLGAGAPTVGGEIRHYILQGFFSHEEQLKLSMREYFRDCGVDLISFSRDEKDYEQLLDELDALASAITPSEPLLAEKMRSMEGLL